MVAINKEPKSSWQCLIVMMGVKNAQILLLINDANYDTILYSPGQSDHDYSIPSGVQIR